MNFIKRYAISILLAMSAGLAVETAAQSAPDISAPALPKPVAADEEDFAPPLHDPFSPIGYNPPRARRPIAANAAEQAPELPPAGDLRAKAQELLRVTGIVKRGSTYVANINGAIVRAGDEIGVAVDGRTVVFIVRAISLHRVQIEPRE